MVKIVTAVIVALTAIADARPAPPDDYVADDGGEEVEPAFNMLGFRIGIGALPIDGRHATTISLGIGVEHPVFTKTRVFGEYEWLWLSVRDERAMDSVVVRPERHGSGHRASLGLRRELAGKRLGRSVRMFADVELGVGFALINDSMKGVAWLPSALAGVRVGYDLYSRSDSSPSRTFEAELSFRAIAVGDGIGAIGGVGMLWGN